MVSWQDDPAMVKSLVGVQYTLAKHFRTSHVNGFPDVTRTSKARDQLQILKEFTPQVDDAQLREILHSLALNIQRLHDVDDKLIEVIANFLELPTPQTAKDRSTLMRRMNVRARPQGPIWANQPRYEQLVEQTQQLFAAVDVLKKQIDNRIEQLSGR